MTSTSSLYFPGQLLNWLYETEYNRSFCKTKSSLKNENLKTNTSTFPGKSSNPSISNTTCSVAVQTNVKDQPRKGILKQVQTDVIDQPRKSTLKQESQTQTSINEERQTKENYQKEIAKATRSTRIEYQNPIKERNYTPVKQSCHYETITNNDMEKYEIAERNSKKNGRYYARILDVVAGMNSSSYKRSPFIQSKKRVKHKGDAVNLSSCFDDNTLRDIVALQNEPAFQKKHISCYSKNHNILRTSTVEEPGTEQNDHHPPARLEEDVTAIQEKIPNISLMRYQNYRPKSTQGFYRTTYDDEFKYESSLIDSPLIVAEKRMKMKERLWKMRGFSTPDLTNNNWEDSYRKDYDKGRYQTEYNGSFQWNMLEKESTKEIKKRSTDISKEPSMKHHNEDRVDEEFFDYYDQVLQNRVMAYQPVLENYAKVYSKKNEKKVGKHVSKKSGRPVYDPKNYTNVNDDE